MTMIGNLHPQLAGAAGLKIFQPNWTPAPLHQERPAEEQLPGYLLRARAAVTTHPHNSLAYARLAQAAQASDQVEEALQAARRAMDLGLDAEEPSAVHAALAVLEAHGHGSELAPLLDDRRSGQLPTNLRLRAAIAGGEHAAAISILSDPQAASQISPDALSLLTWLHLERGEFPQAVAAGRRAQWASAAGVALYANLGYAHAALGQLSKAIKLTRQAQALAPLHRGVGLNLALYVKLAEIMMARCARLSGCVSVSGRISSLLLRWPTWRYTTVTPRRHVVFFSASVPPQSGQWRTRSAAPSWKPTSHFCDGRPEQQTPTRQSPPCGAP